MLILIIQTKKLQNETKLKQTKRQMGASALNSAFVNAVFHDTSTGNYFGQGNWFG